MNEVATARRMMRAANAELALIHQGGAVVSSLELQAVFASAPVELRDVSGLDGAVGLLDADHVGFGVDGCHFCFLFFWLFLEKDLRKFFFFFFAVTKMDTAVCF